MPHHGEEDEALADSAGYFCPVYQTGEEMENEQCERDFVISIVLPNEECADKWIKRRVNAMIKK